MTDDHLQDMGLGEGFIKFKIDKPFRMFVEK